MILSPAPTDIADGDVSLGAVVALLQDARRKVAAAQADEIRLLARAHAIASEQTARVPSSEGREREMPARSIAAEIAAALRRPDRGMQNRMHDAAGLVSGFAATVAALHAGAIEVGHVRAIHDAGAGITDPESRARFEQAALAVAERETVGRAKPIVAVLAARIHPVPLAERHVQAAAQRRVWVRDLDEGMAELVALLPAELAHGIRDRLTQHARALVAATRERAADVAVARACPDDESGGASLVPDTIATDSRTTDQIRADVLTDLLLTAQATSPAQTGALPPGAAIRARVQVVIPAATLCGAGDEPAELVGFGPISPAIARRIAAGTEIWDRVFVSPTTGIVEQVDRYRPTPAQRRLLDSRDEHCRFPGCRRAARDCDLDHTVDAARGGPTALVNLANLCPRHHRLKHATAWSVQQLPHGVLIWTSPTGRVYPDVPRRAVEFDARSADPPPF